MEGKNIAIEYRFAEQKNERLPDLAADLVRLKVDLIVVASTQPVLAAKNATTTIPIVMTNAGDPVASGLVASLARPGGNVTGISSLAPELNTKRLEILKDAVPKLVGFGFLRSSADSLFNPQIKELRPAANEHIVMVGLRFCQERLRCQPSAAGILNALEAHSEGSEMRLKWNSRSRSWPLFSHCTSATVGDLGA